MPRTGRSTSARAMAATDRQIHQRGQNLGGAGQHGHGSRARTNQPRRANRARRGRYNRPEPAPAAGSDAVEHLACNPAREGQPEKASPRRNSTAAQLLRRAGSSDSAGSRRQSGETGLGFIGGEKDWGYFLPAAVFFFFPCLVRSQRNGEGCASALRHHSTEGGF